MENLGFDKQAVPDGHLDLTDAEMGDPKREAAAIRRKIEEIQNDPNHPESDTLAFLVRKLDNLESN